MKLHPDLKENLFMRQANIVISVLLIAFTGFYAVLIARLPDRNLPHTLGAAFMPWVLAGTLLFLSLLLLINSIKDRQIPVDLNTSMSLKELTGIAGFIILIVFYILLLNYLGFVLASILFMAALIYLSGSRKPLEISFFSVATTIVVYLLFEKFFEVQLPDGTLF